MAGPNRTGEDSDGRRRLPKMNVPELLGLLEFHRLQNTKMFRLSNETDRKENKMQRRK